MSNSSNELVESTDEEQLFSDEEDEEQLSTFLSMFPTPPHYTRPRNYCRLWSFWSQSERSQNNLSSDDPAIHDPWVIREKIKSSLSEFELTYSQLTFSHCEWLIQFWAPVTISGRRLLTTSGQPFALTSLDTVIGKHRLRSVEYQYNIDVYKLEGEHDPMIITGATASAFLNQFPMFIADLSVHRGCPLVRSALECELVTYLGLPICDHSQRCVGVLEIFRETFGCPLLIVDKLNKALKGVDLSMCNVRELVPYKTIDGLERAKDDIGEALKVVCEAHNLGLAQVWIPNEDKNHLLKLVGYCVGLNNGGLDWSYYYYNEASGMLPLKMGEGLVGKTLEISEARFCKNISKLSNPATLVSVCVGSGSECSCFAICLRSNYTHNFDYVFEFLWPVSRNVVILLESLFLTLKRCLPNFKFASGAQLGDELCVIDVDSSSGNEARSFKINEGIKSSLTPEVSREKTRQMIEERRVPPNARYKTAPVLLDREMIELQFGKTMKDAARNLKVSQSTLKRKCKDAGISWQGSNFGKRKVYESYNNQDDTNEEDGAIQNPLAVNEEINWDESSLILKAQYEDDVIKFYLPIPAVTLAAIQEVISKDFQLNHVTYKLKYYDEDEELILMTCNQHVEDCIKSLRLLNRTTLRLLVVPFTR